MTLEQQVDFLAGNLRGWEQSAIQRIAKRVGKYGKMSLADVKSINNIYVVNQDMEAITRELAQVSGRNIAEIEQMYGDLLAEQHLQNKPLYDYRNSPFVPFADNKELQAIVRAYSKTTAETVINLSKTKMLYTRNAKGQWVNMAKSYHQVLDQAVMQVTTGTTDFYTAMRESVLQLGGSGINVDYGGGVMRRLDTVVRQNLLWGAKQASVEYNEMIGEELGCDGYEIDWHSNPRPSHEFMQGQQYIVGSGRKINGVYFESFEKSGAADALNDYGCLHFKTPIICGVSEPRYSSQELSRLNAENARKYEINGKEVSGYEATQMQRRIETEIRKCKDEINALQGLGNSEQQIKDLRKRIKTFQGKYNEISEITGFAKQPKRMSVPKSKNVLTNVKNNDKVNIEIDELTPCLRRLKDNKIVDTEVFEIKPNKKDFSNWEFDWTLPQQTGHSVYAIKAKGDERIQGLVAMKSDERNLAYHIDVAEAAPFNNPHHKSYVKKEYDGVGGHLFAEAVRKSYEDGFGGAVYFAAKSDLIEHYQKELGAILTNPRLRLMFIDETAAMKLYERYYGGKIK